MPAMPMAIIAAAGMVFVESVLAFQGANPIFTGMDGSSIVHEFPMTPVAIPFVVVWSWIVV